jgi:hypothetical protein
MTGSPSIVPEDDNRDIYLVLDDFGGRLGRAWRETDEAEADRATLVRDLLDGQYANPVRIVAFNTAEGWSRDASEDIAASSPRPAPNAARCPPRSRTSCSGIKAPSPGQLVLRWF